MTGITDTIPGKANGFFRLVFPVLELHSGAWALVGDYAAFAEDDFPRQSVKGFQRLGVNIKHSLSHEVGKQAQSV
jgi:hypothetical protein